MISSTTSSNGGQIRISDTVVVVAYWAKLLGDVATEMPAPSGVTPSVRGVSALSNAPNLRHSTVLPPPTGRERLGSGKLVLHQLGLAFSSSSMP